MDGDLFKSGLLGYFGQLTALSYVAGLKQGGHHYLAAGLGSYGYEPDVDYTFGIPRSIHGGGAAMNIPIVNIYGYDGDGSEADRQNKVNYVLQVGTLSSALEHAVPEQMFVTEENPGEAISAVKALSKASAAGQRIYRITQANQASVLSNIHHGDLVMNEIRNALNTGKEVITHTDAVSVPGWSGAGYIIYDPVTGDGAYKIGGGANGSFLFWLAFLVIVAIALAAVLIGGPITIVLGFWSAFQLLQGLISKWDGFMADGVMDESERAEAWFYIGSLVFQAIVLVILGNYISTVGIKFEKAKASLWRMIVNMYFLVFNLSAGPRS